MREKCRYGGAKSLPTLKQFFRATVGEKGFDITLKGDDVFLDGERVEYSFEHLSGPTWILRLDGRSRSVTVIQREDGRYDVTMEGRRRTVRVQDERALLLDRYGLQDSANAQEREVHAPMPGLVLDVKVQAGQTVEAGEGLLVLEAMKMENEMRAATAGIVVEIHVKAGDAVEKNTLLIEIEPA